MLNRLLSSTTVNPKMKDVVRTEVLKLLAAGIIYLIADSKWVSLVHCVPKKGGMTVVPNDKNELIPQRILIGYRMCIDLRKLKKSTRKDHYQLPFIDQMLERLSKNTHFCYLDGYSSFSQIHVNNDDQEKTTLLVLIVLMLIDVCRLVYAMPQLLFKGVCLLSFMVSVRRLWRFSWKISPFMEPPLTTVSTILIKLCRDAKK